LRAQSCMCTNARLIASRRWVQRGRVKVPSLDPSKSLVLGDRRDFNGASNCLRLPVYGKSNVSDGCLDHVTGKIDRILYLSAHEN
jgi:hypothetical protein